MSANHSPFSSISNCKSKLNVMYSLPGAMSSDLRASLGITHVLSVCPNYPSTGPHHLQIPVLDTENENLLIHLPQACRFIQDALDSGGRVLVHCVMGVSRSCAVTAAYCECLTYFGKSMMLYSFQLSINIFHLAPSNVDQALDNCESY